MSPAVGARRAVIVGGGVIGSMHALFARRAGYSVVHLEREADARGASVRNFGLVWVGGRAAGPELELALSARALWEELASSLPSIGFRANGSLTVARTPEEVKVLSEVMDRDDAGPRRLELLDPAGTRRVNPAVRGEHLAALLCRADAAVEPRLVPGSIRTFLLGSDGYRWLPGRQALDVADSAVRDSTGEWHRGDLVVLATGAADTGVAAGHLQAAPLRRCRLQMMQTAPLPAELTTSIADGDSLRYYPAYDVVARTTLPDQHALAAAWGMQLLLVQRLDGGLTIGDTHAYAEPFDFAVEEAPYEHLRAVAESILGYQLPPVVRRWAGVYSQVTDGSLYHRAEIAPGVVVVTGPGGRGMTLSPAIAEETFHGHP